MQKHCVNVNKAQKTITVKEIVLTIIFMNHVLLLVFYIAEVLSKLAISIFLNLKQLAAQLLNVFVQQLATENCIHY